jgi:hypothetical protein
MKKPSLTSIRPLLWARHFEHLRSWFEQRLLRLRCCHIAFHTPSGTLNRTIVGLNADTLYIWMAIDSSHEDLVLTIPNISDGRHWTLL